MYNFYYCFSLLRPAQGAWHPMARCPSASGESRICAELERSSKSSSSTESSNRFPRDRGSNSQESQVSKDNDHELHGVDHPIRSHLHEVTPSRLKRGRLRSPAISGCHSWKTCSKSMWMNLEAKAQSLSARKDLKRALPANTNQYQPYYETYLESSRNPTQAPGVSLCLVGREDRLAMVRHVDVHLLG